MRPRPADSRVINRQICFSPVSRGTQSGSHSGLANSPISEGILESKLQLAHGDTKSQLVDDAKALVSRIRRRARKWRARQNVPIGSIKVRMVQHIKGFRTELKLMTLLVGHAEVLVYFGIERENPRRNCGVSMRTCSLCLATPKLRPKRERP